jgi:hypothetical protein
VQRSFAGKKTPRKINCRNALAPHSNKYGKQFGIGENAGPAVQKLFSWTLLNRP